MLSPIRNALHGRSGIVHFMSTSLKERYLAHYAPLIRDFVREVEDLKPGIACRTPQPFFPLFGEAYERSALRVAIVGQDTKGWRRPSMAARWRWN
jgi:hypothetical protein